LEFLSFDPAQRFSHRFSVFFLVSYLLGRQIGLQCFSAQIVRCPPTYDLGLEIYDKFTNDLRIGQPSRSYSHLGMQRAFVFSFGRKPIWSDAGWKGIRHVDSGGQCKQKGEDQ